MEKYNLLKILRLIRDKNFSKKYSELFYEELNFTSLMSFTDKQIKEILSEKTEFEQLLLLRLAMYQDTDHYQSIKTRNAKLLERKDFGLAEKIKLLNMLNSSEGELQKKCGYSTLMDTSLLERIDFGISEIIIKLSYIISAKQEWQAKYGYFTLLVSPLLNKEIAQSASIDAILKIITSAKQEWQAKYGYEALNDGLLEQTHLSIFDKIMILEEITLAEKEYQAKLGASLIKKSQLLSRKDMEIFDILEIIKEITTAKDEHTAEIAWYILSSLDDLVIRKDFTKDDIIAILRQVTYEEDRRKQHEGFNAILNLKPKAKNLSAPEIINLLDDEMNRGNKNYQLYERSITEVYNEEGIDKVIDLISKSPEKIFTKDTIVRKRIPNN